MMNWQQIAFIISSITFFCLTNKINKIVLNREEYKVLNPVSIYTSVWSIAIIVHACIYEYKNYSFGMYISVIVGVIFFSIGFWFFHNKEIIIGGRFKVISYNLDELKKILNIFTAVAAIRCVYMTYTVYRVAGSLQLFITQNTLVRNLYLARANTVQTYIVELPLSMLTMIGFVILGIYLGISHTKRMKYVFIWTALEFIVAYVTMSKLNMVVFIFAVLYTYMNFTGGVKIQRRFIRRILPILGLGIIAFLFVVANQRNYQAVDSSSYYIFRKGFLYVASPFEAYGRFLEGYAYNHQLRMSVVDVGDGRTNVFTWFKPFIQYISYPGIALFPFLMGGLAGLFYNMKQRSIFWITANTWTNCMLFMSFYSYLWVHLSYLACIPLSALINVLFSRKLYRIEQ